MWIFNGNVTELGDVGRGPGKSYLFFLTAYHLEISGNDLHLTASTYLVRKGGPWMVQNTLQVCTHPHLITYSEFNLSIIGPENPKQSTLTTGMKKFVHSISEDIIKCWPPFTGSMVAESKNVLVNGHAFVTEVFNPRLQLLVNDNVNKKVEIRNHFSCHCSTDQVPESRILFL